MNGGTVNHYGTALKAVVSSGTYNCYAKLMDTYVYQNGEKPTELFAGGKGTEDNPYLVSEGKHISNIFNLSNDSKKYIKLIDDIEYTGESSPSSVCFSGIFDGNGHSIQYDLSNYSSAPYLFMTTNGKTEIKNLEWIAKGNNISSLIAYPYYDVTFDNVVAKSEKNNICPEMYGVSPFCCCVYNNTAVSFKKCISEINYTLPTGANAEAYGGIFIGNYALNNSYVSFENCINKGRVSGQYLGFFVGNTTKNISVTDSAVPSHNENYATIYVKDCKNEGIMIGTNEVSAFGTNNSTFKTNHKTANDQVINAGTFVPGTMIVGNITASFVRNENNLMIRSDDNSSVSYYIIGCGVNMIFISGSSAFTYTEIVNASEISSKQYSIVNKIIAKSEFSGNYDDYVENNNGQYNYIIVQNSNGTRDIVVNMDKSTTFERFSKELTFFIAAYNSEDLMIGYNVYTLSDIAND